MYESHWGLSTAPFPTLPDSSVFEASPTHDEALARLHFLVEHGRRLGLLMGSSGVGKSLLLDVFAAALRREGVVAVKVDLAGAAVADLLWQLAAGLGASCDPTDPPALLWQAVADQIVAHRYTRQQAVLLLDDADVAGPDVLVQVGRLARHDPTRETRVTLVLSGRRERMHRLGEDLLDRVDLRVDLEAWDADQTRQFVTESLAHAGRREPVFADAALARLQELSAGVPRRVGRLADLALVAGAGRQLSSIDADTVQSACEELGVGV